MVAPEEHDYAAAVNYLSLLLDEATANAIAHRLRSAATTTRLAKDLLRSSELPLLPAVDQEVARDLAKVGRRRPLSPVLLVRGDLMAARRLTVADGYHRICASYHIDDDAPVSCRIVDVT